ncbi:MAG: hypothetical protein DMG31_06105 [Acidobacteria bacterium]|nr:MAG: hypothetical protein DMG31_06105 [Acidobacteriota bacterium]
MAPRGQKFRTSMSDAIIPIQASTSKVRESLLNQNSVGTRQNREVPAYCLMASRYPPAGRSPSVPISPCTCCTRESNAEKKIRPRARRKSHRDARRPGDFQETGAGSEANSHVASAARKGGIAAYYNGGDKPEGVGSPSIAEFLDTTNGMGYVNLEL